VPVKRIKRVKKTGSGNMYFHEGTQKAIVKYQSCEDPSERELIYKTDILPAFMTLAENLIFMHGFAKGTDFESLRDDCITHLFETIKKWDESRGKKAFSYFNVVAKNYLIIQTKKRKKRKSRHISLDDESSLSYAEKQMIELHSAVESPDDVMIESARPEEIKQLLLEIKDRVTKENEVACIDSIIEIFDRSDDLDFLNKRAVFVYLRDLSGLSPKRLSIAMSSIRKHYRELSQSEDFDIF